MATEKTTRGVTVLVPGAQPEMPAESPGAAPAPGPTPPVSGLAPENEGAKPPESVDLEALRDQIRREERASLHAELTEQMQVASTVVSKQAGKAPARSKHDYRNMRAADIDPATLTAPVMTLDGYLCPPAPEAKK